jgi:superfamily II DNA or RNA helicase
MKSRKIEGLLSIGAKVRHNQHGTGSVIVATGHTVVVRFESGIHECLADELEDIASIDENLLRPQWDTPLEVINKIQAEAIVSINDTWGVFARSKIELLPHQLWVCRQVNRQWPMNWLVADDVGLGKTIEAGLILTPLLVSRKVKRLLVLCPASLVDQWQYRLRTMFDIRLTPYLQELDTARSDFWQTHNQVVASIQTLRMGTKESSPKKLKQRRERLLESEPWDLILVDEAHHLNAHEKEGMTLGYQLVRDIRERCRGSSLIFFTGTPHRGKNYGFLALLQLLRPDIFDTDSALEEQLSKLPEVMIRNNKCNVTDMEGHRLFQEHVVKSETYMYSDAEKLFYEMLSDFITQGRAYVANLSLPDQRTATLVLIAMQKLASSSVAAIRRAISNRLAGIRNRRNEIRDLNDRVERYREMEADGLGDEVARLEETISELSSSISLMAHEEKALAQLLDVANNIVSETKICKIIDLLESDFPGRSVLFFTEYKATQSLLMSALITKYGEKSVTFINGDERADGVITPDGIIRSFSVERQEAARRFNKGEARFLVSTEAGGEGIDLQENCYTLIHVDLPWNPMRLHQRVGRLNRYGQRRLVEVLTLRNDDTVESMIWDKLNEKLALINKALAAVMDEPEDMLQLVLGMTSPNFFTDLFSHGQTLPKDKMQNWFDQQTGTLGGRDVLDAVRLLVGNVSKFNFRDFSKRLPKIELKDLEQFFESTLSLNGRKMVSSESGISFKTPDAWGKGEPAIRSRYENMTFDREMAREASSDRLLGIGHRVFDKAVEIARESLATTAILANEFLSFPVVVFRIRDRITSDFIKPAVVAAVQMEDLEETSTLMMDWEVLNFLNGLPFRKEFMRQPSQSGGDTNYYKTAMDSAFSIITSRLDKLDLGFRAPEAEVIAALFPCK